MNIEEIKRGEQALKDRELEIVSKAGLKREAVFARFPLVFTLLGTFGLVATFYGFERLIDQIQFFSDNPVSLLLTGIGVLLVTGGLYKKLQ